MKRSACYLMAAVLCAALTGCTFTEVNKPTPTEPVTEAPTEPETEAPTEPLTEAPMEPETEAAQTFVDTGWKAAYRKTLEDIKASPDFYEGQKWDLQDLNNDGTPELLVTFGIIHGVGTEFYEYRDGQVLHRTKDDKPENYGTYGTVLICPEEQLIGLEDVHMGVSVNVIAVYGKEHITELMRINENSGMVGEEEASYLVNHEEADKETYDRLLDEFQSKNWREVGDAYTFDDLSPLD